MYSRAIRPSNYKFLLSLFYKRVPDECSRRDSIFSPPTPSIWHALQLHSLHASIRFDDYGVRPRFPSSGQRTPTSVAQFSTSERTSTRGCIGEATGIRLGPDRPHTFSPPRIPRDRVAPKGLDPRAATRPHRFAAQSRMTIAPPPPTQPSRAARSSSGGARGGGSARPISARSSYAASNLGHVIGGRRFFVSLAVAVEQRRSRGSGRFVARDPSGCPCSTFARVSPFVLYRSFTPIHCAARPLSPRFVEERRESTILRTILVALTALLRTPGLASLSLPPFYTLCPFPTLCRAAEFSDWNTWLTSLGAGTIRAPAPLIICPPSL